jgi:hypothetical protein
MSKVRIGYACMNWSNNWSTNHRYADALQLSSQGNIFEIEESLQINSVR